MVMGPFLLSGFLNLSHLLCLLPVTTSEAAMGEVCGIRSVPSLLHSFLTHACTRESSGSTRGVQDSRIFLYGSWVGSSLQGAHSPPLLGTRVPYPCPLEPPGCSPVVHGHALRRVEPPGGGGSCSLARPPTPPLPRTTAARHQMTSVPGGFRLPRRPLLGREPRERPTRLRVRAAGAEPGGRDTGGVGQSPPAPTPGQNRCPSSGLPP